MSMQSVQVLESREIRRRVLDLLGQMQHLAGEIEILLIDEEDQGGSNGGS